MTGATGIGLTTKFQVALPLPALLVAWIVIANGLPAAVDTGHETTPVPASMVMPEGPAVSDHVTGGVPCASDGVGPV